MEDTGGLSNNTFHQQERYALWHAKVGIHLHRVRKTDSHNRSIASDATSSHWSVYHPATPCKQRARTGKCVSRHRSVCTCEPHLACDLNLSQHTAHISCHPLDCRPATSVTCLPQNDMLATHACMTRGRISSFPQTVSLTLRNIACNMQGMLLVH